MLNNELQILGYNPKESLLIIELAVNGKASIQGLSKRCSIPRTSLYHLLDKLMEQKIIASETVKSNTFYAISDPAIFNFIIQQQKSELERKEIAAKNVFETLVAYASSSTTTPPKIESAEGKKEVEKLLYKYNGEFQKSYKNINYYTMWGYQDHTFVEEYRKWHEYAWKNRLDEQKICLFSNEKGVLQQKKEKVENREIRIIPSSIEFASSIWIHAEYVLMAKTREKPHFVLVIKDATLSANLRAMFMILWERGC